MLHGCAGWVPGQLRQGGSRDGRCVPIRSLRCLAQRPSVH